MRLSSRNQVFSVHPEMPISCVVTKDKIQWKVFSRETAPFQPKVKFVRMQTAVLAERLSIPLTQAGSLIISGKG
jgi:hypothetical protein